MHRGESHRIYYDNVHIRNITGFQCACADLTTFTSVSEVWISQRRFPRKSITHDRITCRVTTQSFTTIGNKCGNWVRFLLRQISRNSPQLKERLCELSIRNLFFPKQINTVEYTGKFVFTSRDKVQLLIYRFSKNFKKAVRNY